MSSSSETPSNQTDFFAATGTTDDVPVYTEICNALYERELLFLAQAGPTQINHLKLRLSALPHRIQKAAHYLSKHQTPLAVDSHNGSWKYKQAGSCPAKKSDAHDNIRWFTEHAAYGLPVPIFIQRYDEEHIELDSIDRVQFDNETLHTNKYGWFTFDGVSLSDDESLQFNLVKPNKLIMAAACSGHRWNHKGKLSPRTLTLRELLLSTTVNWKKFTLKPTK